MSEIVDNFKQELLASSPEKEEIRSVWSVLSLAEKAEAVNFDLSDHEYSVFLSSLMAGNPQGLQDWIQVIREDVGGDYGESSADIYAHRLNDQIPFA
ncbi:hypothetical protein ACIQMR_33560 [Streptomyces sp. NPDC091376]|uniref:hypothetical protein n=1 Tax=Streptomyces sp. NPDC091376 TaxID=3365994 RepID=UPI00382BDD39